jgi:hypothetical protein
MQTAGALESGRFAGDASDSDKAASKGRQPNDPFRTVARPPDLSNRLLARRRRRCLAFLSLFLRFVLFSLFFRPEVTDSCALNQDCLPSTNPRRLTMPARTAIVRNALALLTFGLFMLYTGTVLGRHQQGAHPETDESPPVSAALEDAPHCDGTSCPLSGASTEEESNNDRITFKDETGSTIALSAAGVTAASWNREATQLALAFSGDYLVTLAGTNLDEVYTRLSRSRITHFEAPMVELPEGDARTDNAFTVTHVRVFSSGPWAIDSKTGVFTAE